jgi:hypothetical protein
VVAVAQTAADRPGHRREHPFERQGRCPAITGRDRATCDNDLPLWLARHNKRIFGWLFVAGLFVTLAEWRGWLG